MRRRTPLAALALCLLVCAGAVRALAGDSPRAVTAVRVLRPPDIDGHLGDPVWRLAEPATSFIQRDPDAGLSATEQTAVHLVYDDEALYIGCYLYDSAASGIVSRLTRRDEAIESDRFSIFLDTFHDNQTGYEFTFNAAGVKVDVLEFDDGNRSDRSWDAVWEVETALTATGWTAEVKIPFRALRYRTGEDDLRGQEWGINFVRYISRKKESDRWVYTPKNETGFISKFGHLDGLRDLPGLQPLEVVPFVVGKQEWNPATSYRDRVVRFDRNGGVDVRYGLSNSTTLAVTLNPDFGQVEADPASLNLSTYERYLSERRPFFIEGVQIFGFGNGGDATMLYSRRIGRAIGPGDVAIPDGGKIISLPQNAAVLGAAKLVGRTEGGLSVGLLEAVTDRETAVVADADGRQTTQLIEPLTHFNTLRIKHDVLDGSSVGLITTSVARVGRHPAFAGGADWNLRFANTYKLDGFVGGSSTERGAASRRSGGAGRVQFSRIAAEHWLWSAAAEYTSRSYDINDAGYFSRGDDMGSWVSATYKEDEPSALLQNFNLWSTAQARANTHGINLVRAFSTGGSFLFRNYWRFSFSSGVDAGVYDDRETRGNGLYGRPVTYSFSTSVSSDSRGNLLGWMGHTYAGDSKARRQTALSLGIGFRPLPWIEWDLQGWYQKIKGREAWVENRTMAWGEQSIFAVWKTEEFTLTARSTMTFTRDLTLQFYGQLFAARGHREQFRAMVAPSSFVPAEQGSLAPDFGQRSFTANIVMRWEYLPGSTLFFVWSHARAGDGVDMDLPIEQEMGDAFRLPPTNVITLKLSYRWDA